MKISTNWLKTLINTDLDPEEISARLTAAGLEVEGTETHESIKGGLKGLVVGLVLECSKHPGADKLSLTKVDVGGESVLSIVCGAPNVAAGQKVVVATVGTQLYPKDGESFEIKKSKIRGELSEGMLCAEDEIGLGHSHEGIIVLPPDTAVGTPIAEVFNIESDTVLEIGLTPNRSDAASHLGVARDLAAILNTQENSSNYQTSINGLQPLPEATRLNTLDILIENPQACPRYSGLVISGITVKESPDWLKNRLNAIGLRPINNVVDVTNFVLHELGQPLHAFDYDRIKGKKIIVRGARNKEKFVTLDGVTRELNEGDLMICNETDPMCIAGVFGGVNSGVTESTTAIFLESAYFDPATVRKTASGHGLKTDASFRFERGADPAMTITALLRATNLIFELAGGVLSMDIKDVYPEKLEPFKVAFSYFNCTELIGKEIDRGVIKNIIQNLGIGIETEGSDGLLLSVPRYKTDVTREADVIEEVMRIYGYNNVEPSRSISYTAMSDQKNDGLLLENRVGSLLEGFGFSEIIGLSLSKDSYYPTDNNNVRVLNALSQDLNVLRSDMIYGGLEAIAWNVNRRNNDLRFFELGKTYNKTEAGYEEHKFLTLFVTGSAFPANPYHLEQKADLSFLKGAVVTLLEKCGAGDVKSGDSAYSNFAYGLSLSRNNKPLAELGAVSREALKKTDISQPVYYACIHWDALLKAFRKNHTRFAELNKFPSVKRDLALLIDKSVRYQQIEELAYSTEKKFLKEVNLFDIYEGEKLGNKRSYAVSFTLANSEATLTDKQIDGVMEKLISNYKEKLGAELR